MSSNLETQSTLALAIKEWFESGKEGVAYSKPGGIELTFHKGVFCPIKPEEDFIGFTFVVSTFEGKVLGLKNVEKCSESEFEQSNGFPSTFPTGNNYLGLVDEAITQIKEKKFAKVVLSRYKEVPVSRDFKTIAFFFQLVDQFPGSFVSIMRVKGQIWIGASPELLLMKKGDIVSTESLAGTKLSDGSEDWSDKEEQEQQIISDYIAPILSRYVEGNLKIEGPVTKQAGPVEHLSTLLSGSLHSQRAVVHLLQELHPTPAICGTPKEKALAFIQAKEGYSRGFYAGYLGEIQENGDFALYVNLRCGQLKGEQMILYAGAGITAKSDPSKEFIETERKMESLLALL